LRGNDVTPISKMTPNEKQQQFLDHCKIPQSEVIFGCGIGAGATTALLMAANQAMMNPGSRILILRKSYKDIARSGGILEMLKFELMQNDEYEIKKLTGVGIFQMAMRNDSTLNIAYCSKLRDEYNFSGAEFDFIGIDHLEQFDNGQHVYEYLKSRLRGKRCVMAANCHRTWEKKTDRGYWIPDYFRQFPRILISGNYLDNPHIDADAVKRCLANMHPQDRFRLESGQWPVEEEKDLKTK